MSVQAVLDGVEKYWGNWRKEEKERILELEKKESVKKEAEAV